MLKDEKKWWFQFFNFRTMIVWAPVSGRIVIDTYLIQAEIVFSFVLAINKSDFKSQTKITCNYTSQVSFWKLFSLMLFAPCTNLLILQQRSSCKQVLLPFSHQEEAWSTALADYFMQSDPKADNNKGTTFLPPVSPPYQSVAWDKILEDELSEGTCLDSKDEPWQNWGRYTQIQSISRQNYVEIFYIRFLSVEIWEVWYK